MDHHALPREPTRRGRTDPARDRTAALPDHRSGSRGRAVRDLARRADSRLRYLTGGDDFTVRSRLAVDRCPSGRRFRRSGVAVLVIRWKVARLQRAWQAVEDESDGWGQAGAHL